MNPAFDEFVIPVVGQAGGGGLPSSILMIVAFIGIFYFVLIRPQQKEAKEQATLVASLQKGDRIVTSSGIHGKIHEAKGDTLVIEISPNAYMTINRDAIKTRVNPNAPAKPDGAKPDGAKPDGAKPDGKGGA